MKVLLILSITYRKYLRKLEENLTDEAIWILPCVPLNHIDPINHQNFLIN
jgi:hypothetical protein